MAASKRAGRKPPPFDLLLPPGLFKDRCAELPPVGRRAQYVRLSEPGDLASPSLRGVRGLYALVPFRCRVAAPEVEELLLGHEATIDERTARCFSGVRNLALFAREGVELGWFTSTRMEGLSIADRLLSDRMGLHATPLRRLTLAWTGMPLALLPATVEELTLTRWAPTSPGALDPVWKLPRLASLYLTNVPLTTLAKAARAPSLEALRLSTSSFRSISRLPRLRELEAFGVTCPPVSELAEAPSLRMLRLRSKLPPPDLEALGRLTALESLTLDFGDIHGVADVASLAFLRTMPNLRALRICGVNLVDRDISPIRDLPRLRSIELAGVFGRSAGALSRSRRNRKIEVRNFAPPTRRAPVTPRRINGGWTIFEDVSLLLKVPSNHEAEALIRRQLGRTSPGLLQRIEFDSEGDSFCATAADKTDAQKLARFIRSLVRSITR